MRALSRRVPRRAVLRYALIALALLSVVLANIVLQRAQEADAAAGGDAVVAATRLHAPTTPPAVRVAPDPTS